MNTRAVLVTVMILLLSLQPSQVIDHGRFRRQVDGESPVIFPAMEEIPENRCVTYDGGTGSCRSAGLCVFRFETIRDLEDSACNMDNGKVGVCCPGKPPPTRATGTNRPENPIAMPDITTSDLDFAGQEGRSIVQRIDQLEAELQRRGMTVQKGSCEYYLEAQFDGDRNKVFLMGRDGLTGVEATLKLVRTFQLSTVQRSEGLQRFSLVNTVIGYTCPKSSPCATTKYRSSDGTCNNLQHPDWGKAFHTYARVLPPRYSDGINEPRAAYDGGPLPSAREVSQKINVDFNRPSKKITVAFTLWAQFLAYDLSLTGVSVGNYADCGALFHRPQHLRSSYLAMIYQPMFSMPFTNKTQMFFAKNGDGIICCHPEIQKNRRFLHPACIPIYVPENDPQFKKYGASCMHFLRSVAAPRSDCTFGPREQLNQVTAFIDGSSVYGSSENSTKSLRSFEKGRLRWSGTGGREMLPRKSSLSCAGGYHCFSSGDKRSNQNTLLTLLHGLMLREHNRIADSLSILNPGWNDEILFKEARRVLVAEIQHITFSEFLPLLLGNRVMSSYGLSTKLEGYSFDYDADLNPAIINSFATAANRFGHSLVQDRMEKYSSEGRKQEDTLNTSFDPETVYDRGNFDALVRGIARQPSQALDTYVSSHLTNGLFGNDTQGLDLVALNIQRGRDHGLPGYSEWRKHCGLPRPRNFEDLYSAIDPNVVRNFSRLYGNVDDVDLYPAGIAENPLPDGVLGPTFACLVAEQYRRLKLGDRFWYENGGMESSFTKAQLQEIRKVTLSRLLCDNTNVDAVQLVAFVRPAVWNPTEDCKTGKIPKVDLTLWKNEPVWT